MANEAALRNRYSDPVDFIVADQTGVEKGAVLWLSGARVASGVSNVAKPPFAGIAAREKIASDGRTRLALFTDGIFDMTTAATTNITRGASVIISGVNTICEAVAADLLTGAVIGKALETATTSEVIQVEVGRG